MSIGFLIGLTTPSATICTGERYGLKQLVHKKHFASAIKKDNFNKFIHRFSPAYYTSKPSSQADRASFTAEIIRQRIPEQLNGLKQLAENRHSNLLNRQAYLEAYLVDEKNLKKFRQHAARGILWLAGSAIVKFLVLLPANYNPYSNQAFRAATLVGSLVGAYKLFKGLRHLFKAYNSAEIRIDKKLRCNKAITDAIEDKKVEVGFPSFEETLECTPPQETHVSGQTADDRNRQAAEAAERGEQELDNLMFNNFGVDRAKARASSGQPQRPNYPDLHESE